jgi:PPOX class probable F420-dependent enzyme
METIPDAYRDLLDSQVATLATIGPNGRPQQSILWFLAEGGTVRFSLNTNRQKCVNLVSNPLCSLLIVDPDSSYRYLELRGHVELEPDRDLAFAAKVGAKYGSDLVQYDQPGDTRSIVTLVADRVRAVDMRS